MDSKELAQRLNPRHLEVPEVEALQAAMAEEDPFLVIPPEKKPNPKDNREYPFVFSHTDGHGKVWKGNFTNKVLTIRDRQSVGVLRARLASGVPVVALDDMTQEINLMIAHLTFSLTERPDWAKDLQSLDDIRLLQELYLEVASHEAHFLGYGKDKEASGAQQ